MTSAPAVLADPLADAFRVVRRIAPPEAPFLATLARNGEDAVLLVDAERLRDWEGWAPRGAHVLAPLDVARGQDGHAVVLPWCVERLDQFLDRRERSSAPLAPGEIVTVAVSVIRGLRAVRPARGAPPRGTWWLTDAGCPVFVPTPASNPGRETTDAPDAAEVSAEILLALHEAAGANRLGSALHRLGEMLAARDALEGVEAALFEIAAPEPLTLAVLAPQRAAGLPARPEAASRDAFDDAPRPGRTLTRLRAALAPHLDDDIAEFVSDALHRTRRRVVGARRVWGRPWLVAGAIAALVVLGGLWWPTGQAPAGADGTGEAATGEVARGEVATGEVATAADPPTDAVPHPSPGASPAPAPDASEPDAESMPVAGDESAGLEGELSSLLERRADCLSQSDSGCLDAVFEDPLQSSLPIGPIDLPSKERVVTLLDDLGGVAVLRVDATPSQPPSAGSATQIAVIVRIESGWVIRDIRDITPAA